MSLPSRERGLKFGILVPVHQLLNVAPLAGAWIEIHLNPKTFNIIVVAPLAGAWIEIHWLAYYNPAF